MIPFIFLYGGGCSIIVNGDCDIRRRRSARIVIICYVCYIFRVRWYLFRVLTYESHITSQ